LARRGLARLIGRRFAAAMVAGPGMRRTGPGAAPGGYGAAPGGPGAAPGGYGAAPGGAGPSDPRAARRPGHDDVVRGEVVDD
jgi:hypothetical protein